MRAAVCREHGAPLVVETVVVARPGPAEVRVDIAVCAICHSDISCANGAWGGETPAIYGHEAAGVVESVGEGVESVKPGDRVIVGLLRSCGDCFHCLIGEDNLCIGEFSDVTPFKGPDGEPIVRGLETGAFADQTVVHHSQVVRIPDGLPLGSASLLACGVLTGFGAVSSTAKIPNGSTVAIIGVGGVGLGAVQGAVHEGASKVIAVDILDDKLDIARFFGATDTVNGSHNDAIEEVHRYTENIGPDYVFVTVGVAPAIDQALSMVRRGGAVVLVGMPASGVRTEFETVAFTDASKRIIGSKMGSGRMSVDVPALIDLYEEGGLKLDEMITNTYPLDRINEAIDEVVGGHVIRNVIVLDESLR